MSGLKLNRNWFLIWTSGRSKDKLDVIPMLRVELCYSEIFNHPPTLIINPPRQLYKKHRPSAKDRSHTDRFLCSRWSTVLQFRDCAIVFYLQRTSLSKLCFSTCNHVVASQVDPGTAHMNQLADWIFLGWSFLRRSLLLSSQSNPSQRFYSYTVTAEQTVQIFLR